MNANIGDLWMPTICLLGLFASLGAFHAILTSNELGHGSMHVSLHAICNFTITQGCESPAQGINVAVGA